MPNPFEQLGAKGAGAVHQVSGAIKGLHGVFNTLVGQHAEASSLLERAKATRDPAKRADLWAKIRAELLSHEKAEVAVLYPAYRTYGRLVAFANEHDQESEALERAIAAVDEAPLISNVWLTELESLISLVLKHVDEEETQWFPEAAELMSKEETADLDQRFKAKKEALLEEIEWPAGAH
ncbi:MAG: hemerythrin domain-containing protein [Archangiaceae bacterium]|nr:hemerythrin domain-containing protein [Archangiaceae bacterium]